MNVILCYSFDFQVHVHQYHPRRTLGYSLHFINITLVEVIINAHVCSIYFTLRFVYIFILYQTIMCTYDTLLTTSLSGAVYICAFRHAPATLRGMLVSQCRFLFFFYYTCCLCCAHCLPWLLCSGRSQLQ